MDKRRPNIVFVLTDDQGYGDLGCTGNPLLQTPRIDAFYEQSVRLTNFHVGPTCAPTRAGLLTGHYANSTGVWHTIGGRSLLRSNEWTLASALQEAGYRTGIFGKWHLGDAYPYRPQDRGFDTTVVHGGGGISQTPDFWGNDYFHDTYCVNGEWKPFNGYCTDVFFDEALTFIGENRDTPFFCYLACNAPHSPYNVADRYADLYRGQTEDSRARFYGMITNIDENFGRLQDRLEELGIADNTILIFMTDNGTSGGAQTDRQGFVFDGYNAGLRGVKNSPYDGGHRVPFFIRFPDGRLQHGTDLDELTANVDFMPTLLDLCEVETPPERTFHGRSLKPLLTGEAVPWDDRILVTDSQRLTQPVKWRQSAVMTRRWRLINGTELYDIDPDREQRVNVADQHPDVVERLREGYESWWTIVSSQFDEEIPMGLGRQPGDETVLTCHDWRNEDCSSAWNQGMVRRGTKVDGYWEVEVERDGMYRFELRRWPREAGHLLTAGIDGDDVEWSKAEVEPAFTFFYTGGNPLPLRKAVIRVGDQSDEAIISPNESFAHFVLPLRKGQTHLEAWFADEAGSRIGAYYVYVNLQGEGSQ